MQRTGILLPQSLNNYWKALCSPFGPDSPTKRQSREIFVVMRNKSNQGAAHRNIITTEFEQLLEAPLQPLHQALQGSPLYRVTTHNRNFYTIHYSFNTFTAVQAYKAAVSVLSLLLPRFMAWKPLSNAIFTSSIVKSPSGPISTSAGSSFL